MSALDSALASRLPTSLEEQYAVVANLDKEIEALLEQRAVHMRAIEAHTSAHPAIHTLHADILCSIFLLSCSLHLNSTSVGIGATLALTQLPLLWTRWDIEPPRRPVPYVAREYAGLTPSSIKMHQEDLVKYRLRLDGMREMMQSWVVRSRDCPLDITLEARDESASRYEEESDAGCMNRMVVGILCGVSKRWRKVSFKLEVDQWNSPLLGLYKLTAQDVPLLEVLNSDVQFFSRTFVEEEAECIKSQINESGIFAGPSLRSLTMNRLTDSVHLHESMPCTGWERLTVLRIDNDPVLYPREELSPRTRLGGRYVVNIFQASPNLTECALFLRGAIRPPDPAIIPEPDLALPLDTPISLLHLRSLAIRGSLLPPGLPTSLHLPSLRTLSLLSHLPWRETLTQQNESESEVVKWVERFGEGLEEFNLEYTSMTESAREWCIQRLPNVVTLRLIDGGRFRAPRTPPDGRSVDSRRCILEALNSPLLDSSVCCPKLRHFGFRMSPMGVEFTEKELVEFILARRRQCSGFSRVVVKFGFEPRIDVAKELETHRALGGGDSEDSLQLLLKYRGDHLVEVGCNWGKVPIEDQSVVEKHWEGHPESW